MSYHSISFTPTLTNDLFSNRFNQIDKIFSTLTGKKPISEIPDYNFIQIDDNQYQLILLIPGCPEKEIDISLQDNQLKISRLNSSKNQNIQYLYHGIKENDFSINFNLYNPIKISKVVLELGLLKINFAYKVPEEKKIQKINIEKSE